MGLTILPRHQNQVCLTNPHALLVHSEHVLKHELLPWEQWHLHDLTEVFYILELGFTLEEWTVKPWLGVTSISRALSALTSTQLRRSQTD